MRPLLSFPWIGSIIVGLFHTLLYYFYKDSLSCALTLSSGNVARMKLVALFLFLVPSLIQAQFAYASLGAHSDSVKQDEILFGSKSQIREFPKYRLYVLSKNWIQVHELADANGNVFAVTWHGSKHPDLQEFLGVHEQEFQKAYGEAKRYHHHGGAISGDSGNLHFELGGRMNSMYGQIWLKNQIPVGMDIHEVK